ncbi:MAG: hypothetical protein JWO09_2841 [Bacteroidetes bacterium]|nr:hypothetical protein [Bacteroidota bacterium]
MQMKSLKAALFFLMLAALFSCKKETDEAGPEVSFHTPFDNQSFMVYDNVPVSASISDESKITSVSVTLVDVNHIPVHTSVSTSVTSPSMTLSLSYPLDNIHLESGSYALLITASDGKNDSHTYQPILITAVPKALKKVFVATSTSAFQTSLYSIDSTFSSMSLYNSYSGDFIGTSASSYYQQVYLCGNYTGNFSGISLATNAIKFTVAPAVSASPYFTGYYSEDKKNYVARYDETVKGYNYTGNIVYNATANAGYFVRKMTMNNGYLVAEEKSKTSAGKLIVSFYSTGTPEQQVAISQDVVAFCEKDDHSVFVFGNDAGQAVIQLYDRMNNTVWNPYPYALPAGSILSALKIDADTYLFGHSNGTIYKYQYLSGSITTYLSGYTALQLKYDELNNDVYIAEANLLTAVDYPSKTVMHAVPSAENIYDFSFLYNR